jgi:hypothetical protein
MRHNRQRADTCRREDDRALAAFYFTQNRAIVLMPSLPIIGAQLVHPSLGTQPLCGNQVTDTVSAVAKQVEGGKPMPTTIATFPTKRGPWVAAAVIAVLASAGCGSSTPSSAAPANPVATSSAQATGPVSTISGAPSDGTTAPATAASPAASPGGAQGGCPSKTVIGAVVAPGSSANDIEEDGPATKTVVGTTLPAGGNWCDYIFGSPTAKAATVQVYYGPASIGSFLNQLCSDTRSNGNACVISQAGATSYAVTGLDLTQALANAILQAITGGH